MPARPHRWLWCFAAVLACTSTGGDGDTDTQESSGTGGDTTGGSGTAPTSTTADTADTSTTGSGVDDTSSGTTGEPEPLMPGRYRVVVRRDLGEFEWTEIDDDTATSAMPLLPDGAAMQVVPSSDRRWLAVAETVGSSSRGWVLEAATFDAEGARAWPITDEPLDISLGFRMGRFFSDSSGLVYATSTAGASRILARPLDDDGPADAVIIGPEQTGTFTLMGDPRAVDDDGRVLFGLSNSGAPFSLWSVPAAATPGDWVSVASFSAEDDDTLGHAYLSPSGQTAYGAEQGANPQRWWVAPAQDTFTPIDVAPSEGGLETCRMSPTRTRIVCAALGQRRANPLWVVDLAEDEVSPPMFVTPPPLDADALFTDFTLLADGSRVLVTGFFDDPTRQSAVLVDLDGATGPTTTMLSGPDHDGRAVIQASVAPGESAIYVTSNLPAPVFGRVDLGLDRPGELEVIASLESPSSIVSAFVVSSDDSAAYFVAELDDGVAPPLAVLRCGLGDDPGVVQMGEASTDTAFNPVAAPNGRAVAYQTLDSETGVQRLWFSEYLGTSTSHHMLNEAAQLDQALFVLAEP
jgi:hypothetical protein